MGVEPLEQFIDFAGKHIYFTLFIAVLDFILAGMIIKRACIFLDRNLSEATGGRMGKKSLYRLCLDAVRQSLSEYERKGKKSGYYRKVKDKMKRSGYSGEYSAVIYLLFKYLAPVVLFIISFAANYPEITRPLLLAAIASMTVEWVVTSNKRKHNLVFQKYIYKIYKYLHNQISSGVMATDAIKTVYGVIEDKRLKDILIRLAASYELTLDIDLSLDEFKSNFDADEAETLCVALKQGIMTGDNRQILAHQEEVMFKRYFNHIQAETDSCKTKSILSVAMFTLIIVIMIAVPLFNDVNNALDKIFVN